MSIELLYAVFALLFAGYLVLDLAVFNRHTHEPGTREIVVQTIIAILLAGVFASMLWIFGYSRAAVEFTTVYITEKMLSLDNLFVILVIFQFFAIERKYQHKVLFYGIIGAVVFRLAFISVGSALINALDWILYLFAIILVYTGWKIIQGSTDESHSEKIAQHPINRLLHRYIPYTTGEHEGRFVLRRDGRLVCTFMLFALVMVEVSDVIFALDSIPAAFAITHNPAIIFTANMAALLGLRSLFFVIEMLLEKLKYLNIGLGAVLMFIGVKFLLTEVVHISALWSLGVIAGILGVTMIVSIYSQQFNR